MNVKRAVFIVPRIPPSPNNEKAPAPRSFGRWSTHNNEDDSGERTGTTLVQNRRITCLCLAHPVRKGGVVVKFVNFAKAVR
jgi:hypothetical protein